jgi:hypothetical protein
VAAGLVVSLVLALTVSAQVKTGKSRLWQALEAGESRTIRLMGSSMSQNAKASWPGELSKQLNDKLAGTATVSESGTANGQTSTTGRFDRLPGVIDAQPDAVIIEYAFCDSRDNKGVPLDVHIDNMTGIVRALREQVPDVEIFIYETGRLSFTQEENQTNLLTY